MHCLSQGANKPFKRVIDVSANDPQREGMAPVTFVRQVGILHFGCYTCRYSPPVISLTATSDFLPCFCFVSQVLAACIYPKLLEEKSLPLDVRQRAQMLLTVCGGGSVGN